jgi:hypothetical protein
VPFLPGAKSSSGYEIDAALERVFLEPKLGYKAM